jgi:hypothetical protein
LRNKDGLSNSRSLKVWVIIYSTRVDLQIMGEHDVNTKFIFKPSQAERPYDDHIRIYVWNERYEHAIENNISSYSEKKNYLLQVFLQYFCKMHFNIIFPSISMSLRFYD